MVKHAIRWRRPSLREVGTKRIVLEVPEVGVGVGGLVCQRIEKECLRSERDERRAGRDSVAIARGGLEREAVSAQEEARYDEPEQRSSSLLSRPRRNPR